MVPALCDFFALLFFRKNFFIELLAFAHLMIVAILAGLFIDKSYEFAMCPWLVYWFMIFGIFALEAPVIWHKTVVTRLFIYIQKNRFWRWFNGLIGFPLKMLHKKNDSGSVHFPNFCNACIKMATSTIAMILSHTRLSPFSYRFFHLMASHTGNIWEIPYCRLVRTETHHDR